MAKAPPWFPWYYEDYEGGTQHLDAVEDHVYRRLLEMQWALGGRLPAHPDRLFSLVPKLRMGRPDKAARTLFMRAWNKLQDVRTPADVPSCPACGVELAGDVLPVYCPTCGERLRAPKFEQDRRGFFNPRLDQELQAALTSIKSSAEDGFKGSLRRWGCPTKRGGCGFRGLSGEEKSCPKCGLDLWADFNAPTYETVFKPVNGVAPPIGGLIAPLSKTHRGGMLEGTEGSTEGIQIGQKEQIVAAASSSLQLPFEQESCPVEDEMTAAAACCQSIPSFVARIEDVYRGFTKSRHGLTLVDREILGNYCAEGVPPEVLEQKIREVGAREIAKGKPITTFRYFWQPDGGALEQAVAEWREGRHGLGWTAEDFNSYRSYAVYRVKSGAFATERGGQLTPLIHPDMIRRSLERIEAATSPQEVNSILQVLASAAEKNLRRPTDLGEGGTPPKRGRGGPASRR